MKPQELEAATLKAIGAALASNAVVAQKQLVESGLCATDFDHPEMARLFVALDTIARENRPLDAVSLAKSLAGQVRREWIVSVVTASDYGVLPERARVLRDAVTRRRLTSALEASLRLAREESVSLGEAVTEAAKALEGARVAQPVVRRAAQDVFALLDRMEQVQLGKVDPVLTTGIHALDAAIGGLQPTLTVVGALPGVGKSALLASIVRNLGERGVKSGVFSLEDAGEWLTRRLMSEASRVPLFVIGNRKLTNEQMKRIDESTGELGTWLQNALIDDRVGLTAQDIVQSAREMIVTHGAKAIFVDHLGEIRLAGNYERHDLAISDALRDLRALAKLHGVPVIVFAHLRRREGLTIADQPRLTDFAFSAGVERMARVGLGLSRPDKDETLRVWVLKQTNGQAGVFVDLPFRGPAGLVGNGRPLADADKHYREQEDAMQTWGNE